MDYFKLAADLARAEAAPTIARVASKSIALRSIRNRGAVCCCSAYPFPHRPGGGDCPGVDAEYSSKWDAEELSCFDREEARAINGQRM